MKFKYELILVYHDEKFKNSGNNTVWRENFVQTLTFALHKVLGIQNEIPCFEINDNQIQTSLNSAKLIILLVDDPFLESNISDETLSVLSKNLDVGEDIHLLKHRILPVVASSLPREMFPNLIQDLIGYDFTSIRMREKMIKEKGGNYAHSKSIRTLWLKTYDLVIDVKSRLASLDGQHASEPPREKAIYLAQTANELIDVRDNIKRDLKRHGYTVYPDQLIPQEFDEVADSINGFLSKTCMSIHLIGEEYGKIIGGNANQSSTDNDDLKNRSIIDVQNKLAEAYCAKLNLQKDKIRYKRIIWINPEIELLSESQKQFTDNIKKNSEGNLESELLQSPIEDLKSYIRNALEKNNTTNPIKLGQKVKTSENKKKQIYLIFDRKDYQNSNSVKHFLIEQGFEVLLPSFDGEYFELENLHIKHLKTCDACVLIAENASDQWLNTKLKDIEKIYGLGRVRPIEAKAILFGDKDMTKSNFVRKNGTVVINHSGQLTAKIMAPFLNKFNPVNE